MKRFCESGEAQSEAAAVTMLLEVNLKPSFQNILTAHQWRKTILWNEPIDNILKAFLPVFKHVYDTFGGTSLMPGQKFFMSVSEFETFALAVPLVNDVFV
jgi:hypothetical protein